MPALAAIICLTAVCCQVPVAKPAETVVRTGRVVLLTEALKATGLAADSEPISKQVVLLEADGTVTPFLSDEAARALFVDARLRDRKAELTVRKIPGLAYFQVVSFKVEEAGKYETPEYYCDVCSISVRSPQTCPCCQGPMELRMKPQSR